MLLNIILFILIIIFGYIIANYNKFVKLNNYVKEAKSQIDILLKQRFDMIPNIVECVKGYAKHEKGTLTELTEMRSRVSNVSELGINDSKELDNKINNVLALAENYPDLKANQQFMGLQAELNRIEDKIQKSRTSYNSVVTMYNTKVESFPSELIAKLFGFNKQELFKLDDESERNNVKLDF